MTNPQISIIVPVYNAEKYLCKCLDSILSQTYIDWECLLINDGSTDRSGEICDEYKRNDDRIKIIHKRNEGVSVARNVALDMACGEWIVFADADDYYLPDALKHLYDKTIANDTDVILGGYRMLVNEFEYRGKSYEDSISENFLCELPHCALWGYMFRASTIQDYHIRFVPGLAYSEDRVFLYEVAIYSRNIAYSSKCVYVYRHNDSSVCKSSDGLRIAKHQFWAAYSMNRILNMLPNDTVEYKAVVRERQKIIRMGVFSYTSRSLSWQSYKDYENNYLKYFNGNYLLLFLTVKALFTYYRRKIVTFRAEPYERKGFFSVFKMFHTFSCHE